jgi:hypothetical protein
MAHRYALARPQRVPVPVLDEQTEMCWWDTANYFAGSLPPRWHEGDPSPYAHAGTLPGYPTFSEDVPEPRWMESPE